MGKTMSQFVGLEKYIRRCDEGDLFGGASSLLAIGTLKKLAPN